MRGRAGRMGALKSRSGDWIGSESGGSGSRSPDRTGGKTGRSRARRQDTSVHALKGEKDHIAEVSRW